MIRSEVGSIGVHFANGVEFSYVLQECGVVGAVVVAVVGGG